MAPDNAWANGLLGIWHLQIVRRGTAPLARQLYGASLETGQALCRRAALLDPAAGDVLYGCATSLLAVDPEHSAALARRLLQRVRDQSPADAAGRLLQAAARRALAEAG